MQRRHGIQGLTLTLMCLCVFHFAAAQSGAVSPEAQEALNLLESEDIYKRQVAFLKLESLREKSVLPVLRKYLNSDDEVMRSYSLRAVAAIDGASSIDLLKETLKNDKHPDVRRAALLGLEPLFAVDKTVLDDAIAALTDRDTSVRMSAVDVVSRMEDPAARAALQDRYAKESRRDVVRVLDMAKDRLGGFE